jgi:hypothetical protein
MLRLAIAVASRPDPGKSMLGLAVAVATWVVIFAAIRQLIG